MVSTGDRESFTQLSFQMSPDDYAAAHTRRGTVSINSTSTFKVLKIDYNWMRH